MNNLFSLSLLTISSLIFSACATMSDRAPSSMRDTASANISISSKNNLIKHENIRELSALNQKVQKYLPLLNAADLTCMKNFLTLSRDYDEQFTDLGRVKHYNINLKFNPVSGKLSIDSLLTYADIGPQTIYTKRPKTTEDNKYTSCSLEKISARFAEIRSGDSKRYNDSTADTLKLNKEIEALDKAISEVSSGN